MQRNRVLRHLQGLRLGFAMGVLRRPRRRAVIRRMCPVVGSWPDKDLWTVAAAILETERSAAGIPHSLKVYAGARHGFFNEDGKIYDAAASTR